MLALAIFAPTFSHADTERTRLIDGLLREVNMQRALNGAGPLRLNKRLSAAAQKYAEDMAKRVGVLTIPGDFFGKGQQQYLRFAFANADIGAIKQLPQRLSALKI